MFDNTDTSDDAETDAKNRLFNQPQNNSLPARLVRQPLLNRLPGVPDGDDDRTQELVDLNYPFRGDPALVDQSGALIGGVKIDPANMALADAGTWEKRVRSLVDALATTVSYEAQWYSPMRTNVWVHDEQTGEYILRDGDGTVHARFATPADIFTDASAYPDGGDRNIKPPVIPEYEIDGDLHKVEWDVVIVPVLKTDENDEKIPLTPMDLRLYEGDTQTPLTDLLDNSKQSGSTATNQAIPTEQSNQWTSEESNVPADQRTDAERPTDDNDSSLPRL